jgi:hypothetical protein
MIHETMHPVFNWSKVITRALRDSGQLTYDDILRGLADRKYYYFGSSIAFAIVEPQKWPVTTLLHVVVAGGTQKGIEELEPEVVNFGRAIGAKKLTALGRVGFKKRVDYGWKNSMNYYEKEI